MQTPLTPGGADRELVEKILSGDESAFSRLLDLYERRVFAFAYRMCGQRQDAEDAVQEVFLSALKALGSFRWETGLLSWLFRIAANRCRRMRRLRAGEPRAKSSLDAVGPQGQSLELPDAGPDPLDRALSLEREEALQKALLRLGKEDRMVVVLRDLQGFSTQESAQIMGSTPGAVKTRLHRARNQLKEWMRHAGS